MFVYEWPVLSYKPKNFVWLHMYVCCIDSNSKLFLSPSEKRNYFVFQVFLNITMSTARLKISFKLMCQCLKVIKE